LLILPIFVDSSEQMLAFQFAARIDSQFIVAVCSIMPPIVVTAPQFLRLGLEIVGFPLRRQNGRHETNIQRFRDKFGPSPESCAAIFVDLQTTHIPQAQIAKPNVLYFLMALHWLKTYPTETGTAATFRVDEKTGRKFVWEYVLAVQALKAQKVRSHSLLASKLHGANSSF
jgi:hypothetical protein